MIRKITGFLVLFLFLNIVAEAGQMIFEFKENLLPNTYNLIVNNNDEKQTVEFFGCYNSSPIETNYHVLMHNGSKYNFDSKMFCEIGVKGRYAVNSGEQGKIPFKISKNIMQNAEKIIFKGVVYVPIHKESFTDISEMRDLIVSYDVVHKNASYEIGDKIPRPAVKFNNNMDVHKRLDSAYSLNSILGKDIEFDEFRLKTK
jgi:hypothetical protein